MRRKLSPTPASAFAIAILAASLLWPQQRTSPRPQPKSPARDLFDEAHASTAEAPAVVRPALLMYVAREASRAPSLAGISKDLVWSDIGAALSEARQWPPSDARDTSELKAISLAASLNPARALEALHESPAQGRGLRQLYTPIISSAGLPRAATRIGTIDVLSVVADAQARSGAYPFRSVAVAVQNNGLAPDINLALLQNGLQAASTETLTAADLRDIPDDQLFFFNAVHRLAPQLDSSLAPVLVSVLPQLARLTPPPSAPTAAAMSMIRAAGGMLLLLEQVDPASANLLRTDIPAAATDAWLLTPHQPQSPAEAIGPEYDVWLHDDPPAALATGQAISDSNARFFALVRQAVTLGGSSAAAGRQYSSDLSQARNAALAALALVDDAILARDNGAASTLASLLDSLGMHDQAVQLALRCLDGTDQAMARAEVRRPKLTDAQWDNFQVSLADLPNFQSYSIAAHLARDAAIAHARGIADPIGRARALATVAQSACFAPHCPGDVP